MLLNSKEVDLRKTMQEIIEGYPYVNDHRVMVESHSSLQPDVQSQPEEKGILKLRSTTALQQLRGAATSEMKFQSPNSANSYADRSQNAFRKVKTMTKLNGCPRNRSPKTGESKCDTASLKNQAEKFYISSKITTRLEQIHSNSGLVGISNSIPKKKEQNEV